MLANCLANMSTAAVTRIESTASKETPPSEEEVRWNKAMEFYQPSKFCMGKGAYGSVYTTSVRNVLMKESLLTDDHSTKVAEKELAILLKLRKCPHIPYLDYGCIKPDRSALFLQNGGINLYSKLHFGKVLFTIDSIEIIAKKTLEALAALHAKGYAHFDVALKNMTEDLILDFGAVQEVPYKQLAPRTTTTWSYRPPEAVLSPSLNQAADIWSLGCSLFELYAKEIFIPFSHHHEDDLSDQTLLTGIKKRTGSYPETKILPLDKEKTPKEIEALKPIDSYFNTKDKKTLQFQSLLNKMLELKPEKRICTLDALKDPFFTSNLRSDLRFYIDLTPRIEGGRLKIIYSRRRQEELPTRFLAHTKCFHTMNNADKCSFEYTDKDDNTYETIEEPITDNGTVTLTLEKLTKQTKSA